MHTLPKFIIFDFDGTIINSAAVVCGILNTMRAERGMEELPFETMKASLSRGGVEMVKLALEEGEQQAAKDLAEFRKRYIELPTTRDVLYEGAVEFIEKIHEAGIPLALCTNKPRNLLEKIIDEVELRKYFMCINAGGDFPNSKPHPSNIEVCLHAGAQAPSDTIFIGDSTVDQRTAANGNVPFYFFSSGYNDGVDEEAAEFVFGKYEQIFSHFFN